MTLVINVPALLIWALYMGVIVFTAFSGFMVEFVMLSVMFILISTVKPRPIYLRENSDVESP